MRPFSVNSQWISSKLIASCQGPLPLLPVIQNHTLPTPAFPWKPAKLLEPKKQRESITMRLSAGIYNPSSDFFSMSENALICLEYWLLHIFSDFIMHPKHGLDAILVFQHTEVVERILAKADGGRKRIWEGVFSMLFLSILSLIQQFLPGSGSQKFEAILRVLADVHNRCIRLLPRSINLIVFSASLKFFITHWIASRQSWGCTTLDNRHFRLGWYLRYSPSHCCTLWLFPTKPWQLRH